MPGTRGTRKNDLLIDSLKPYFTDYDSTGVCVNFACGSTGWRGTGGTTPRTLVHEAAFQLDAAGNARGNYSVDLQIDRNVDTEVASGDYSLLQGRDSMVAGDYSVALGWDNLIASGSGYNLAQGVTVEIGQYATACVGLGVAIDIDYAGTYTGGQYLAYALGESHDFHEANYVFVFGSNNDVIDEAFGGYSFGEQNDFEAIGNDYPTYTGQYAAIQCITKGDVWSSLQVGEDNELYGTGATATLWVLQSGFQHYADKVRGVLQVGEDTALVDDSELGLFNGCIVHGDGAIASNSGETPWQGIGQSNSIAQGYSLSTWTSSWTTAYQYPIRKNGAWSFDCMISGAEYQGSGYYRWDLDGLVINANGTMYLAYDTLTKKWPTDTTKEWRATVDSSNKRLLIQYRDTAGTDNTDCRIYIHLRTAETGFGGAVRSNYSLDPITVGESVSVSIV